MDQTNNVAMSMLQIIANQSAAMPKTKENGDELSEFQKLLDKKAQEKDPLFEEPSKAPAKAETPAKKQEKTPAQNEDDPVETSKKAQVVMVGQVQPQLMADSTTLQVPGAEEEVIIAAEGLESQVWAYEPAPEETAVSPDAAQGIRVIDVSDPEADAILEATAPGADNSPAALLEKVVNEEIGHVAEDVVAEAAPRSDDDDIQVELIDVDRAPQRIFHDVEAAPVKVGETESPRPVDEADVVSQVDTQIAQAMQSGSSTVTVKLNPEHLGEVTVQISMRDSGILAIAISARSDDTRALLERHAVHLQELVGSRVREPVEVSIQRGQENQQSQNQQRSYDGHNGHAQEDQQERRQQRGHTSSQDFMQQLRLGLIPADGEF